MLVLICSGSASTQNGSTVSTLLLCDFAQLCSNVSIRSLQTRVFVVNQISPQWPTLYTFPPVSRIVLLTAVDLWPVPRLVTLNSCLNYPVRHGSPQSALDSAQPRWGHNIPLSHNHRNRQWLRLKPPLDIIQSKSPAQSKATWSGVLRTMSSWVTSICKDRDPTASLVNLFMCSINLTVGKKIKSYV